MFPRATPHDTMHVRDQPASTDCSTQLQRGSWRRTGLVRLGWGRRHIRSE